MILDGKKLKDELLLKYKDIILKENLDITLAVILIGDDLASSIYVNNKKIACEMVGIKFRLYHLPSTVLEKEVVDLIRKLNQDDNVTGIILQSPVPKNLDYDFCCQNIASKKDIDGFTKDNIYNLYLRKKGLLPCTVKGILKLLEHYNIPLSGSNVLIVGRGNIVGKPLSLALSNKDATVTLCHSKTKNLKMNAKNADIIISAVGKPGLISADMVNENACVIDVGISRVNGKIVGDVMFDEVKDKCLYITPVPGGVGPMTVAMIIDNLIETKRSV